MKRILLLVVALAVTAFVPTIHAQAAPSTEEAAIRTMLDRQALDWNRGDIEAFATGYKNSPDTLFVGATIRRGYQGMLESYRKNYPTKAAMGVLTFTNVEVHPLDAHFALVLGNFHLERTAEGGGNADGNYSLVIEKTPAGWKIVVDHTEAAAPKVPAAAPASTTKAQPCPCQTPN